MSVPDEVLSMVKIITLNLSHNIIISLPDLDQIENLKELYLQSNALMKLPNLPISLTIINIENNIFKQFPFSVLQPLYLEELYTANNQISQFPIQLFQMKNLKKFSSE
jgi:Leucine-rich repeat (LRR) protein